MTLNLQSRPPWHTGSGTTTSQSHYRETADLGRMRRVCLSEYEQTLPGASLTVVRHDHQVDTVVQVFLCQAVHQHAHDPVYLLQGLNDLKKQQLTRKQGQCFNVATEQWSEIPFVSHTRTSCFSKLVIWKYYELQWHQPCSKIMKLLNEV